jgi:hypothetical protein
VGSEVVRKRPDVAPEPTFPTDIRARTRSDIGLSVDRKADTTSVTADSGKLDEGEAAVLAMHPLKIGSSEVGKRGYRQVMEDALEDQPSRALRWLTRGYALAPVRSPMR